MKSLTLINLFVTLVTFLPKMYADPDPNFHIYLAFGQSNMEGQATIDEDEVVDPRFQMMATAEGCMDRVIGQWYDAYPPLAHCGANAGIVDYFGRKMVRVLPQEIRVGVIVVAVSGGKIQLFDKEQVEIYTQSKYYWYKKIIDAYGGNPYERLIDSAEAAKEVGVIKGILVHQGEDNVKDAAVWNGYLKIVYENILKDLNLKAEDVPLLVGEMVRKEMGGIKYAINDYLGKLPEYIPTAHVISSEGLAPMHDNMHFSNESYVTFGERYADEMLGILKVDGYEVKGGNQNQNISSSFGIKTSQIPQIYIISFALLLVAMFFNF